jgi:hypothetical protein
MSPVIASRRVAITASPCGVVTVLRRHGVARSSCDAIAVCRGHPVIARPDHPVMP